MDFTIFVYLTGYYIFFMQANILNKKRNQSCFNLYLRNIYFFITNKITFNVNI